MKAWKRVLAVLSLLLALFVSVYLVFTGRQMLENYEIPTEGAHETTASTVLDS